MKPSPGYLAGVMVPMWLARREDVTAEAKLFYAAIANGINPSKVVRATEIPKCIYELGERNLGLLRMTVSGNFDLPAHRFMDDAFEAEDMDEIADMARQRKERKIRSPEDLDRGDVECAGRMDRVIRERISRGGSADARTISAWALSVRDMRVIDKHSHKEQEELLSFALSDRFWVGVILSPKLLRKHWDRLLARRLSEAAQDPKVKKQLALDLGKTEQGELSL